MYAVDLPYPPIKVKEKNPKYADLILQNYASATSEFTAIAQYVYHQIAFSSKYKEVGETLKGISIIEMRHLQILGELLIALGSEPGYYIDSKKKNYWSGKLVDYNISSLKDALSIDIEDERDAIIQYKKTVEKIDDEYINNILKRIILDEELHIQLLFTDYTKYAE